MASQQMLLAVLAIGAAAVLPFAMAAEIPVGGDEGWHPGFDYTLWAEGMEFRVGDKLVFKYKPGAHNVIEVGGEDFKACNAPASANVRTTGNDVVSLDTAGKKWFLCSKGDHCSKGDQKLFITVLPDITLQPSASPPSSSSSYDRIASNTYQIMMAAAVTMVAMIVIA